MFKRGICCLFVFFIVSLFCGTAFAAESGITVSPSAAECFYGGSVTFQITTSQDVAKVKAYIGGRPGDEAQLVKTDAGVKQWTAQLVFSKTGNNKVTFKAYSQSGKRLGTFPKKPIIMSVKHLPPVTKAPIILDYDRAVLLAQPPQNCGVKQRQYGFYLGTSPDELTTKIKSNSVVRDNMNKLVTELTPDTVYYYKAYVTTSQGTIYGQTVSFKTPAKKEWTAQDAVFPDTADRYNYLFGTDTRFYKTKSPAYGYAGSAEASKHMVTIEVPVWKIRKGRKVSGMMKLTVNYKLENNVKAIFQEIYELDIKFPINVLKGYSYRRIVGPGLEGSQIISHHSFGAAIDINKPYNKFYITRDRRNPKNPYYIPQSVIDIFAKYGWAWGGNFKEGYDTMHFQYLGLDLTEQ